MNMSVQREWGMLLQNSYDIWQTWNWIESMFVEQLKVIIAAKQMGLSIKCNICFWNIVQYNYKVASCKYFSKADLHL